MASSLFPNKPMQNMSNLKNMMGTVKSAGNPTMMMQQMLGNNPNYQKAMELIKQHGGNAQSAFYALAQQMGVNPNDILNQLK